jgi:dihydroflavonol-4-reductase
MGAEASSIDLRDAEGLAEAFEGLDQLYHVAGGVGFSALARRELWDLNVLGAMNVLEAAIAAKVERLVFVSSISVLGRAEDDDALVNEECVLGNRDEALAAVEASLHGEYAAVESSSHPYSEVKRASFHLAMRYAERGLDIRIVFPATVVGPGELRGAMSEYVSRAVEGRLPLSLSGGTNFVDSRDCAMGMALAMEEGRAGEGYILGGPEECNLGYAEFQRRCVAVGKELGVNPFGLVVTLPRPAAMLAGFIMEGLAPKGQFSRDLVRAGSSMSRYAIGKARRELGYEPVRRIEESIRDCYEFASRSASGA